MSAQETIVVFTRYPEPGTSKTRLIPALGPSGAAELHRRMTKDILSELQRGTYERRPQIEICFTGGSSSLMREWLGSSFSYHRQVAGDLGERMCAALLRHHRRSRAVCLLGTDCPGLTGAIVIEAFRALRRCELVLGPSHDGGYYLIGCSPIIDAVIIPKLFSKIRWGGARVCADTRKIIEQAGRSCHLLPTLHDIDTPEDLRYLSHHSGPQ